MCESVKHRQVWTQTKWTLVSRHCKCPLSHHIQHGAVVLNVFLCQSSRLYNSNTESVFDLIKQQQTKELYIPVSARLIRSYSVHSSAVAIVVWIRMKAGWGGWGEGAGGGGLM